MADALAHAHGHRLVHRDVKPGNVLLTTDEGRDPFDRDPSAVMASGEWRAVLVDFGIALIRDEDRLTNTGRTPGTVRYMAPEQVEARGPLDGRADVFSLGVLLFRCLTDGYPFAGTTLA